ncbi:MAG: protein kinase domain-containing protein, partial [Planctomycetota bacterium]
MNDKPKEIKTIFAEALERQTVEERAAYLDKACADDPDLRSEVEELLKSHDHAGSFLEFEDLNPQITLDQPPPSEREGTVIGPYKLLERIGEGGMAYVYMAEQERPIRRRVALKIIKLGMDTRQVTARFEAERQALAMMDHPNIAKVFDAGATETGRPYFAMELVKGVTITASCDNNKLNTRQRLDLFIQVCNAVQHAHQKGIIHRDIKPSNVMVTLHDGKPVPKVIDFGIAKATSQRLTEKTVFTRYAQMIGTPEYMSPEQAEFSGLGIDTRSDIYSLGVLLYELLTGTTPFDAENLRAKGYGEMQRIIRESEPLKPSTRLSTMGDALTDIADHRKTSPDLLARLVRGDLDWIVMKTLEKDRTRRYEAVNALAKDIRRHLDNDPVEAGPPDTLYRIRKFIKKRRKTVATAAIIAALLIIGLIATTTLYFIAEKARNQEALARTAAEKAKKTADEKAEHLRRANYVNSIQLANAKYKERNVHRVRELLDSCPTDLRGWEWHRLNYVLDESLMTLASSQVAVFSMALSPDGKRIASSSIVGKHINIWDADSGAKILAFEGHGKARTGPITFNADGKKIVSGGFDNTVKVWDAATGEQLMTLKGHEERVHCVASSPDGKRIVSGSFDRMLKIWDASNGQELHTLSGHEDLV